MLLSTKAILDLLNSLQKTIPVSEYTATANQMDQDYRMAQAISEDTIGLTEADLVVVLSGRSGFDKRYAEAEVVKHTYCAEDYDPLDTLRRMEYGIKLAIRCTHTNQANGYTNKAVPVYFSGGESQNVELKKILKTNLGAGGRYGMPGRDALKNQIIIDDLPFPSTVGQAIALGLFLEKNWTLERPPKLIFVTSTYHVVRVMGTFGSTSPLLSPDFYKENQAIYNQLSSEMKRFVLQPDSILKRATLTVLGCDRRIADNPGWERDLYCDMQARYNYATYKHCIAPGIPPNVDTFFKAITRQSLLQSRPLAVCDADDEPSLVASF